MDHIFFMHSSVEGQLVSQFCYTGEQLSVGLPFLHHFFLFFSLSSTWVLTRVAIDVMNHHDKSTIEIQNKNSAVQPCSFLQIFFFSVLFRTFRMDRVISHLRCSFLSPIGSQHSPTEILLAYTLSCSMEADWIRSCEYFWHSFLENNCLWALFSSSYFSSSRVFGNRI